MVGSEGEAEGKGEGEYQTARQRPKTSARGESGHGESKGGSALERGQCVPRNASELKGNPDTTKDKGHGDEESPHGYLLTNYIAS